MAQNGKRGMLLVISGPSGCGKGTLLKKLFERDSSFRFSISCTTREKRPGEIEDVHYHFLDEDAFARLKQEGAFLESAMVHGHHYGTLRRDVEEAISRGESIVLDIDTQGAEQVMAGMPECVSVFLLPPSFEELEKRLRGRQTESEADIQLRLKNGHQEVLKKHLYQYQLINDDVDAAFESLWDIIQAEQHRTLRYDPEVPEKTEKPADCM